LFVENAILETNYYLTARVSNLIVGTSR